MPGTTRYSATFDRPYEEDDRRPDATCNGARRSRSQSVQMDVRRSLSSSAGLQDSRSTMTRSSSIDGGGATKVEHIPTRTVSKTVVKTHNNPFQFVKVGSCPLYRKAEEQIKKTKEVKKPEVLKEEEEEWQTNLDSWKSRRRKMSEDVFRRQEEIRQFEQEEQSKVTTDKKIKTFSEMVESRAHRGRALSLCLISSPLDTQEWGSENKNNTSNPFSDGSEENSAVNSEDERVSDKANFQKGLWSKCTNGNGVKNGSPSNCTNKVNETSYTDSGLESISSSHRTGDTPDSCSDFSQDSGSSIDCDSPRVSGMLLQSVNLLQDFKETPKKNFHEPFHEINLKPEAPCEKEEELNSTSNNNCDMPLREHVAQNGSRQTIESENEVFVDDFEELHTESKVFSKPSIGNSIINNEALQTTDLIPNTVPNISFTVVKTAVAVLKENDFQVITSHQENTEPLLTIKPDSERTDTVTDVVNSKALKKNRRRKRVIAKVESVEISSEVEADAKDLCIVFQSQPSNAEVSVSNTQSDASVPAPVSSEKVALNDVLPVEKVAEEMEKLILQQLEEEERAKEMSSKIQTISPFGSPDHNLTAPPRVSEPPKEKPPPPPTTENEVKKPTSLKRINSTKRIKKEISKRRSNFLGIDDADDSMLPVECLVQPPPPLEQFLNTEMELERENRKRLESEADHRLKLEEVEMLEKERLILAQLEERDRLREQEMNTAQEEERIQQLIEERQKAELEQAEAQRLRLMEEQQLREREEYIRKQEVGIVAATSAPALSDAANLSPPSNAFPLHSVSGNCGEKGFCAPLSAPVVSSGPVETRPSVPAKPAVPPKPLKKKEAIRKERERLRQEQELLQREREEHRQRLMKEQEQLLQSQPVPHAPLLSRVGPVPLPKPSFQSPLTPPARDPHVIYASHGLPGAVGHNTASANGCVDPLRSSASKLNKQMPSPKNGLPSDSWGRQKSPSPKKSPSSQDSYNQNHWLIQEAEMRRLAELRERQQQQQRPRTHLAEDGATVCGPLLSRPYPTPAAKPPSEHVLSVSGRKRCSHCSEELGRGAAMIIESLQLYYHLHCFQCCVCGAQLGNGSCGADVRVRNHKLHCHNCYSNDEAGLKFSQV